MGRLFLIHLTRKHFMNANLRKLLAVALIIVLPLGCGPDPAVPNRGATPAPGGTAPMENRDAIPPRTPPTTPDQPANRQTGTDNGVGVQVGGGQGVDVNVDPNRPATNENR